MSRSLHDVSKNLARDMSRRQALLLFGASIMAVVLGDRVAGTAYADQNNQGNDNSQGNENGNDNSQGNENGGGNSQGNQNQQ